MSNATVQVPVPATGTGAAADVSHLVGPKTVQLSGTFEGSYDLLATQDGITYDPIVSFNTGDPEGLKQTVSGAFSAFKLRNVNATPATVVACEVTAQSAAGENHFTTVASLGAGFTGLTPIVDTWSLFPPTGVEVEICYLCRGGFRGPVVVLGSMDGAAFNPIGTFRIDALPDNAPAVLELGPLPTQDNVRYLRLDVAGVTTAPTVVTVGGRVPSSSPGPTGETLAETYDNGAAAADQTMSLTDARGGAVVVDGTSPSFTGACALVVRGSEQISTSLAVGPATPTARVDVAAGTAAAGTAPLKIPSGVVLTTPEPGAVEADHDHIFWTDAGGARLRLDNEALPVADWSENAVRYILLSGDHGDDANVGYVDAPAGTTFTVAYARSIALRTTHRIAELRPPLGDSRRVVVLFEPRDGNAPYDYATPGDGLGSDDRSGTSGYALMISRGSDLTNTAADRKQIGFVTAIPGPNVDGSFTVAGASYTLLGVVLQLTGASLPAGYVLARYRLRIASAISGTLYAPVAWGDPSATPDPTKVVAYFVPGAVSPGDKVWIETPGVTLHDSAEAQDFSRDPDFYGPSSAVGFRITGVFGFGASTDGSAVKYSGIFVDKAVGGTLQPSFCGSVDFSGSFTDETGTTGLFSSLGLAYSGDDGVVACGSDGSLSIDSSTFAATSSQANYGTTFSGGTVSLRRTSVQRVVADVRDDTPNSFTLDSVICGPVKIDSCGYSTVSQLKYVPYWGAGTATFTPRGPQNQPTHEIEVHVGLCQYLYGSDPLTDPGIVLRSGVYTASFDMNTNHVGTGVQVGFDDTDDTKYVLVTYDSLAQTGFELEGGIKIICAKASTNYPQGKLLCPRGRVGIFYTDESSSPLDPGVVVFGHLSEDTPTDYRLSKATAQGVFTQTGKIVGVTLSNMDPANPYVVFGSDGIMLVQQADSVPLTGGGVSMYLVGTDGLVSPLPDPTISVIVGNVTPLSTNWSGVYREISFQPGDGTRRAVAGTDSGTVDAPNTDFVTMYSVPLLAGHKYKVKAHLTFSADAAAGIKVQWLLSSSSRFFTAVIVGQTPTASVTPFQAVIGASPFYAVGPTAGWVDLEGVIDCETFDDGLQVQFAQQVANAVPTSLGIRGSYITVEEV